MKNTMPRLIDDKRFWWRMKAGGVILVFAALGIFAYCVYMAPYWRRLEILRNVATEGRAELARFNEDFGDDTGKRLQNAFDKLGALESRGAGIKPISSHEIDPSVYVEKEKATELALSLQNVMEAADGAFRDLGEAMALAGKTKARISELSKAPGRGTADSAASDLEQCLIEIDRLKDQPRPKADETNLAIDHFKSAYNAMNKARTSQDMWLSDVKSEISTARTAMQGATDAFLRMKEAKDQVKALEDEVAKLHIDESGAWDRLLRYAEKLEDDAVKMRQDVDSTWKSAEGAGKRADMVLNKAEEQMRKAKGDMDALVKSHGISHFEASLESMEKTQGGFSENVGKIRSSITAWTEAGEYGLARGGYLASASRMEELAKELRAKKVDLNFAKAEVAALKSVDEFSANATDFISAMGNIEDDLAKYVQTANESVVKAEKSIPDWGEMTMLLNQRRQKLCDDIARAESAITSVKGRLGTYHADGNVRNEILQEFTSALQALEDAKKYGHPFKLAANGLEYENQKKSWDSFDKAGRAAIEKAAQAKGVFDKAKEEGKFYSVSYKPGAEVWALNLFGNSYEQKGLMPGNGGLNLGKAVEIAAYRPNTELKKIGWKFAVKMPKTGKHVLQVNLSTVSGKLINTSAKGKRSSRRIRDGEITVSYAFSSANGLFEVEDGYTDKKPSFRNGERRSKLRVVSSTSTGSGSWEEFEFTINSIVLDVKEHSIGENTSWDYTPITFTVTLDGAEVELYHAVREP